jgi:hypothetical protein
VPKLIAYNSESGMKHYMNQVNIDETPELLRRLQFYQSGILNAATRAKDNASAKLVNGKIVACAEMHEIFSK